MLESALRAEFSEYLNAEIVLRTIVDVNSAVAWLQSTYLYIRVGASSGMQADCHAEADTVAIREVAIVALSELQATAIHCLLSACVWEGADAEESCCIRHATKPPLCRCL